MNPSVKAALEAGDLRGLIEALASTPGAADAVIAWGDPAQPNLSVPLHYVCDLVFEKRLEPERALILATSLIEAGANLNAPHAKHGDTPLIAAASLGVTNVGRLLIAAGADVRVKGLFGASALHWAAMLGDATLAEALLEAGAPVDEPDAEYGSTPLGWALHGRGDGPPGSKGGQLACAALLIAAGAEVRPEWRAEPDVANLLAGEGRSKDRT